MKKFRNVAKMMFARILHLGTAGILVVALRRDLLWRPVLCCCVPNQNWIVACLLVRFEKSNSE